MAKIVQISDFKGEYAITMNAFSGTHLQSFIDKYELIYLRDLLGIDLSDALYTDITTPFTAPSNVIYSKIFNKLAYDKDYRQIVSNGIKEMLVGFMFFEYTRFQQIQNTITGNIQANNEVSTPASWGQTSVYNNYNKAIDTYRSIQYYVCENTTDYPLFNGIHKGYTSQFI